MLERFFESFYRNVLLLIGFGAVLEFSYLAVLGTFTNPETGALSLTIVENLEFWGPILEFLIGAPYLLALITAFVASLASRDISPLVFVICLVPTLSLGICIVAPYFTTAVVMDTITFGQAANLAVEGVTATSVAFAVGGPTAASMVGAYYGFLQAVLAVVAGVFGALFHLSRLS